MIYAYIISLILHVAIFAYFFVGEKRPSKDAYPKIMNVDLVSLPPVSRGKPSGTETPGQPDAEAVKPKAQTKVETKPETAHMAEIEKKKRQNRKKLKPKPQTKAEKAANEKSKDAAKPGEDQERFGLPDGVETGSEFGGIRLDGANFETPTYLNILFAKIKNRWDNPFQGTDQVTCVIYFTVLSNGNVIDAIVENSSGIPAFDQSALRAVIESKPPPLPLEYTGNQLGIHLEFQYLP